MITEHKNLTLETKPVYSCTSKNLMGYSVKLLDNSNQQTLQRYYAEKTAGRAMDRIIQDYTI